MSMNSTPVIILFLLPYSDFISTRYEPIFCLCYLSRLLSLKFPLSGAGVRSIIFTVHLWVFVFYCCSIRIALKMCSFIFYSLHHYKVNLSLPQHSLLFISFCSIFIPFALSWINARSHPFDKVSRFTSVPFSFIQLNDALLIPAFDPNWDSLS